MSGLNRGDRAMTFDGEVVTIRGRQLDPNWVEYTDAQGVIGEAPADTLTPLAAG